MLISVDASTQPSRRTPADAVASYANGGYATVEGWCTERAIQMVCAIDRVQKQSGVTGHVAEIGIHHGKLFILMALMLGAEERCVAVDVFGQQHLNVDRSGRGNRATFLRNFEVHGANCETLAIIEADSNRLVAPDIVNAARGNVRLFSIDGSHTSAATEHDLATAAGAIGDGGVILVDDYFNQDWPGVSEGVGRFMQRQEASVPTPPVTLAPFAIGGNKVFFSTSAYAPVYRIKLREALPGVACKTSELYGSTVDCYAKTPAPK